mmetsp:Transcript_36481/g.123497  ORF Transcript_36481/g.123497 Transcript_36481/m.123497 type:complete len:275 (+) Transcript_36481:2316-3140(+)
MRPDFVHPRPSTASAVIARRRAQQSIMDAIGASHRLDHLGGRSFSDAVVARRHGAIHRLDLAPHADQAQAIISARRYIEDEHARVEQAFPDALQRIQEGLGTCHVNIIGRRGGDRQRPPRARHAQHAFAVSNVAALVRVAVEVVFEHDEVQARITRRHSAVQGQRILRGLRDPRRETAGAPDRKELRSARETRRAVKPKAFAAAQADRYLDDDGRASQRRMSPLGERLEREHGLRPREAKHRCHGLARRQNTNEVQAGGPRAALDGTTRNNLYF